MQWQHSRLSRSILAGQGHLQQRRACAAAPQEPDKAPPPPPKLALQPPGLPCFQSLSYRLKGAQRRQKMKNAAHDDPCNRPKAVIVENDSITILFRARRSQTAANTLRHIPSSMCIQLPSKSASVESKVGHCHSKESVHAVTKWALLPCFRRRQCHGIGGANITTPHAPSLPHGCWFKCHHTYYFACTKVKNDES